MRTLLNDGPFLHISYQCMTSRIRIIEALQPQQLYFDAYGYDDLYAVVIVIIRQIR